MTETRINAIIPAYGSGDRILTLIDSLMRQRLPEKWHINIIIVDNGLAAHVAEQVRRYRHIEYIVPGRNLMYLNSIAYCLKLRWSDFTLVCTQDIELVDRDVTYKLTKNILRKTDLGTSCISMPTHKSRFGEVYCMGIRRYFCLFLCDANRNSNHKGEATYIEYFSGCFFLCEHKVLESIIDKVGNWPSMYLEDIAMSLEAKRQGVRLVCALNASIVHDYRPVYTSWPKMMRYFISSYYFLKYLARYFFSFK